MSTTFKTGRTTVCECGEQLSHCDDVAAHGCAPVPGDFTICVYCGMVYEFDGAGVARMATGAAMEEFRALPEYLALVQAVEAHRFDNAISSQLRYPLTVPFTPTESRE